ncbi:hypothetical protein W97_08574 [Coniosporium apollinis CBS 100218]|uniref:Transcription regulator Rua1 C-terminal domain-containing protein n=1 Tax=Coniosporium apollinis (strain CBS 100218) TaxID=1168221 RepID=R7Z5M1_CONA1|nr:uncharacterized protein W97_08574 [Coniosporium apollinis CBS 100218]EON69314.1 hypothetical protein W97_08574 [Coniosporium apollinis CBS 100218]
MNADLWSQKAYADFGFSNADPDLLDHSYDFMVDENTSIIDLRQTTGIGDDVNTTSQPAPSGRRMSESSFSMSSGGVIADFSTYEDSSASEKFACTPDHEARSNPERPFYSFSPMASPRRSPVKSAPHVNHRRGSPSPHTAIRSSPYNMVSDRNKRWSTGMHGPVQVPLSSHTLLSVQNRFTPYTRRHNSHHSFSTFAPSPLLSGQPPAYNALCSQPHVFPPSFVPGLPSKRMAQPQVSQPLPSQGPSHLHSAAKQHNSCSSQFAALSDAPDLYSSLRQEAANPPEEDMNPSDPKLVPHEQDLRFIGDLYTPRWVRGHGHKREGWCGLCQPGRWLVLKNSAFWYDKSFTHGVSAAGAPFQGPLETRRIDGNPDAWEGLCGSCGGWIALKSSKNGTTWFRHAYKCHVHPKAKDAPKRRRETSQQLRARALSSASSASSRSKGPSADASPIQLQSGSSVESNSKLAVHDLQPAVSDASLASSSTGTTVMTSFDSFACFL